MNIIEKLEAEHAARLPGAKMPDFQPGDTVVVNVKVAEGDRTRIQAYEGVCIARSGGGLNENFTVRKISYGEGVERVFPVYSPMIELGEGVAPRQGAPRQTLLPARSPGQVGAHRRAHGNCGQQGRGGGGQGRQRGGQGVILRPRSAGEIMWREQHVGSRHRPEGTVREEERALLRRLAQEAVIGRRTDTTANGRKNE